MAPAELRVDVVYCPQPGQVDLVTLALAPGATLDDALRDSGLLARHGLDRGGLKVGIWSKLKPGDTVLRDGDRIEVYRGLKVDPKEARRQRYKGKPGKAAKAAAKDRTTKD